MLFSPEGDQKLSGIALKQQEEMIVKEQNMTTSKQQEQPFRCPQCRFAAVCGERRFYQGGQ